MIAKSRRAPARLGLALAVLALAAALLPAPRPALAASIDLSIEAGWLGSRNQPADWVPVVVNVTNHGNDFRGNLEIDGRGGGTSFAQGGPVPVTIGGASRAAALAQPVGATANRRLQVVIAAGATQRFTTYAVATSGFNVVLTDPGGGTVASASATLQVQSDELLAAVVSDSRDALAVLSGLGLGQQNFDVAHVRAADLPEDGVLLRGLRAVILDGASTDSLTASQRAALADYVNLGGGLLIVGGSGWRRNLAGLPAGLAPVTVGDVRSLGALPQLAGLLGEKPPAGPVTVAVATPVPGAVTLVADGGLPLLVAARHGEGQALFLAFDPEAEPIASWSGQRTLLRQTLARLAAPAVSQTGKGAFVSSGQRESSISQALSDIPSLDVPSIPLLGFALLGYVLLAGPVNYFVLRRLRRRDLAWVTIPVLVLLLSGAAYGIGIKGKGAALVNRVRVLHVGDSGTRAYAETYTGVFVPSRGSHVVGPAAGGLVTDLTTAAAANFGGNPTAGSTTVLGGGANAEVRFDGVPAFTMRAFATSGFVDLGGGIAQKLTLSGGVLSGTVVSSLPFSLTDAYVVVGGTATAVGIVRPGADTQLAARGISYESQANSSYNGAGVASQIFPGMFSSSDRDQQRRGHVVEALFPNTPAGDPGPVLIGWAGDSPGPLQVDGQPTPSTDLTLVVVPLHPAVAAGTIGSGDLAMRLVDLPSAAANQFPYFYLSANSTARFEAALPAARWTDLRVRISHQSAFFGGFGTPGCPTGSIPQGTGVFVQAPRSGCIAPATVEVFNFAKDAWTGAGQTGITGTTDSVDLGPGADLVSPAGVVEVRLRAGTGDTQAIASVTLAGGSAS